MNTSLPARQPSRPLVPEDLRPQPSRFRRALERACFASLRSAALKKPALDLCEAMYPHDTHAAMLLSVPVQRAAISGASTQNPAWAGEVVGEATIDFLSTLPQSAAAQLMARGTTVSLDGTGTVMVPVRVSPPDVAPWVGENQPIPVLDGTMAPPETMSPRKLGMIVGMSGELARHSQAEPLFRQMLTENAAMSLDSAYFSSASGDAVTHAGLLRGLTSIPVDAAAPLIDVLAELAAAVGAGGSGEIVFITGPGRGAAAAVRSTEFSATVLPSLAVPEARVIAVDVAGLVHGGGAPMIDSSTETTIVMRDDPTDLGVVGTPAVIGAPSVSYYQADMVALRLLIMLAFTKRRAGCVAFVDLA